LLDRRVEFRQLSFRQFLPSSRWPSATIKTKEQLSDFIQCETVLPRALYYH
jgi:hypothetical protein